MQFPWYEATRTDMRSQDDVSLTKATVLLITPWFMKGGGVDDRRLMLYCLHEEVGEAPLGLSIAAPRPTQLTGSS